MTTRWDVHIDTRKLDQLIVRAPDLARNAINATAIDIQADATENTKRVDTGAMKNSWVVQLCGGGQVSSSVPGGAPLVSVPPGGSDFAVVGSVVEYTYYWEVGHRGFGPELMLTKAVEKHRAAFERKLSDAFRQYGIE